ncbi:phospholipase D [Knoellia flava TL1]|uniref:Phospholipase D n=2 Tax=Knoellia flava TaxID=913969 RepID=A0A8H9FR78_9MICO|nr:phospholipase D-like domain-containing protein [Knoellia flava]KGN31981.1 phospholipase D [Knoellia flava TL1]GGB65961.1 phospholipase D [Knoellia flava]
MTDAPGPEVTRWLLTASERGNPHTTIDEPHPGEQAWSTGNSVRPLVDGASYFAELFDTIEATRPGDLVLFAGWRVDGDQQLTDDPSSTLLEVLDRAEDRGVQVRGLIWRSHTEQIDFSAEDNREVAEELADEDDEHAEVLLDMRVRRGGSHHQKFVVVRHGDDPSRDVAFVGGIDVAHSRRDDSGHRGDPQQQALADEYGPSPGWHDVQCAITGPAVADVETVFRERWDDPSPLTPAWHSRLRDRLSKVQHEPTPLPERLPAPPPVEGGTHVVQVLRTYPHRHLRRAYPFAPRGERSIARAHLKAIEQARHLIYLEEQYLWSSTVSLALAEALSANPELHLITVLPHRPDLSGMAELLQLEGRFEAIKQLTEAAPDRFAAYGIENHAGWPVYVHAKVVVIDDWYATIGSDNVNRRSWSHDSELAALVVDDAGTDHSPFARSLRLRLAAEHLDRPLTGPEHDAAMADCVPAAGMFAAYAEAGERLRAWHEGGMLGTRPSGRLRPVREPDIGRWPRRVLEVPQRLLGDPDGRPFELRRRHDY